MKKTKNHNAQIIRWGITIAAIFFIFVHLIWPTLAIDAIALTLLFIAVVPWLSPIFEEIELPGGWKVKFRELEKKLQPIIAKQTEPIDEANKSGFIIRGLSVNDDNTRSVIIALGDARYTWRFVGSLMKETGLSATEVLTAIKWLKENELVTESMSDRGHRIWALTREGLDLLSSISEDEHLSENT